MRAPREPTKGQLLALLSYRARVDPNTDWVLGPPTNPPSDGQGLGSLGPGADYFFLDRRGNREWLPVLIGLSDITVAEFAAGVQFQSRRRRALERTRDLALWADCTYFSDLDKNGLGGPDRNFYCAPIVTKGFFDLLFQSGALREVVTSVTLGLPLDFDSLPPNLHSSSRVERTVQP